jgi:hypothetical protein
MRRLWLGVAATVLVVAATTGTISAKYFSGRHSNVASSGAKTMSIVLAGEEGSALGTWDLAPFAPSSSNSATQRQFVVVKKVGQSTATLRYRAVDLVDHENGCNPAEQASHDLYCEDNEGDLSTQLTVQVTQYEVGVAEDGTVSCGVYPAVVNGEHVHDVTYTLRDLGSPDWRTSTINVNGTSGVCLGFAFALPDRTDNNLVQGDSASFRMQFSLMQT